eukprot:763891-Hanusia_phi.AAC.6
MAVNLGCEATSEYLARWQQVAGDRGGEGRERCAGGRECVYGMMTGLQRSTCLERMSETFGGEPSSRPPQVLFLQELSAKEAWRLESDVCFNVLITCTI